MWILLLTVDFNSLWPRRLASPLGTWEFRYKIHNYNTKYGNQVRNLQMNFASSVHTLSITLKFSVRPTMGYLQGTVPGKCKLTVSTRNSILEVFENRASSFEARVSSIEFRGSRFEFRDTRRIFREPRLGISRKRLISRTQNNNKEQ